MCINLDDLITLKGNNYTLTYKVDDIGTIKNFNVNINSDYVKATSIVD